MRMFTAGTGSAETITVNGSLPSYISQVAGATSTLNGFQLATSNTFSITGSGGLYVSIPLMDRNNGQGSAALIQTGSGLLVLSASGNYSGGTVVNGGTLQLGNNAALGANTGDLTVNTGGLLDLHGFSPIEGQLGGGGLVDNLISTASTLTVNYDNDTSTFSGTIQNSSGIVSLVKAGTGALYLTGTNTYSGTTTVSGGMLQFVKPSALYSGSSASWTAANITAGSAATLAVNVDGNGGFTPGQAGILFAGLTGSNSGLLNGAAFGIDTTNATAPVVFSAQLQDSAAGSVGLTKFGAGTLQVTNASNSYTGPTTVVNGQLMLLGANTDLTAPGLVTVTNSTSGGMSILSLLKPNVLGSGGDVSALAPISLNSTNGGTVILEVGAQLDPTGANSLSYVLVQAVSAGQTLSGGQLSLGSSGNTADVVGFSASSANYAQRTVGLYTSTNLTTLQTLQFGANLPGKLVLGSPTANGTLVLENPIDLYSASAGTSVQLSAIRGMASQTPEGEYAGPISNSSSAAVSVTYGGSGSLGGLIFTSSASSFNASSLQLAGGGLFLGAADYASATQTGPLGSGTSALIIGTAATPSGANLAFMTYGPNSRIIGSNASGLFTDRNIIVNAVPGSGSVVLGGLTDDYTAMGGSVQLNGPATFYAAQSGRVDFTGPISGSGAVQIGGVGGVNSVYVEGAGTTGIQLGANGTIAFTTSNNLTGSTTINSGRLLVNGSLYASSPASTITISGRDPGRHEHDRWTGHDGPEHDA